MDVTNTPIRFLLQPNANADGYVASVDGLPENASAPLRAFVEEALRRLADQLGTLREFEQQHGPL